MLDWLEGKHDEMHSHCDKSTMFLPFSSSIIHRDPSCFNGRVATFPHVSVSIRTKLFSQTPFFLSVFDYYYLHSALSTPSVLCNKRLIPQYSVMSTNASIAKTCSTDRTSIAKRRAAILRSEYLEIGSSQEHQVHTYDLHPKYFQYPHSLYSCQCITPLQDHSYVDSR